jgi:hypothetical protein
MKMTMKMMRKSALVLAVALFAAAGHTADEPVPKPPASLPARAAASGVVLLTCNPFYLPARSIWPRKVAMEVDADGVRSVEIDGVAVYTFNVNGTVILTAVDGERIQIDIEALTWSSDLRGLATGRGGCTR